MVHQGRVVILDYGEPTLYRKARRIAGRLRWLRASIHWRQSLRPPYPIVGRGFALAVGHFGMPRREVTVLYWLWGIAGFALCGYALATEVWTASGRVTAPTTQGKFERGRRER